MKDIQDKEDVKVFVNAFYTKVRNDSILSAIFNDKIHEDQWPYHLSRMYSFWNTVLFGQKDYLGNPFSKHLMLPIEVIHFEKWLFLFVKAIDNNFKGPKADDAKERAKNMSRMFQSKLEHIRSNPNYSNIM